MQDKSLAARVFPSLSDFAFLAPAVLLFVVMAGSANLLADGDTGWHLRSGDWILEHHAVPTSDFFSFTKPGQPWFAWEWLWEASFALLHRMAGMPAVLLASVAVLCFTSLLLFQFIRRQAGNDLIAFAVTLLSVFGMSIHFLARPHLFSFLFAVILLGLIESRRMSGRSAPWIAIPLFVLWANVHPGFAVGLIILAAYTAAELLGAITSTKPEERRFRMTGFQRYCLLTAACAIAPLANPYGYHLYAHMLSFLSDPYVLRHVAEYMPIDFRMPPGRAFELMLMLGAPAAVAPLRYRQFAPLMLYVFWAHLGLMASRNVPFFMIAMAAPVAVWLEQVVAAIAEAPVAESIRQAADGFRRFAAEFREDDRTARINLFSLGAMVVIFLLLRSPGAPPKFQAHYDPESYPEAALPAVRQLGPSARVFSTDLWGGFLVYRIPGERIFWDGRVDFYGTAYNQAAVDAAMGRPDWIKTLAGNRITAALIPPGLPLATLLAGSPGWRPVYRDQTAVLFEALQ